MIGLSQSRIISFRYFFNPAKLSFNSSPLIILILLIFLIPSSMLFAQDFWESTGGPKGADIYSFSSNDAGEIFCVAYGRIYRSDDDGGYWEPLYEGLPEDYVLSILCVSPEIVLAGTNHNGLYRSSDNGKSWNKYTIGTEIFVYCFLKKSSEIFAGTQGGVYKSTDMGESWIKKNSASGVRCFTIDLDDRILAGSGTAQAYISTDNGESWTAKLITPGAISVRGMIVNSSNHIFAGLWGSGGLYKSTDHGETWWPSNNGIIDKYISSLLITNSDTMFAGNAAGIYSSVDNGTNWVKLNDLNDAHINTLYLKDGILFAGARYGVGAYRSTDAGVTWECINNNIFSLFITGLVTGRNGDIFASSWYAGVFRYRSGEWEM